MNHVNTEFTPHYQLITRALNYLQERQLEQPSLQQLAAYLEISPAHLQRVFQNWVGVSPKQFLQHLTRRAALQRLQAGATVFDAALDSGLSGSSRLHDLLIQIDAITPGQARRAGAGVCIYWGIYQSIFGATLLAWTERGLTFLAFCDIRGQQHALQQLQQQWPQAKLLEQKEEVELWGRRVFQRQENETIPLWLNGSPFQIQVWQALMQIPANTNVSYGDLATAIGKPRAARAIGTAVGRNPISLLIPCHRVIRKMGVIGEYRWGSEIKMALLGNEGIQSQS